MTNHERTGKRDLFPSAHHRQMGRNFWMCDVDWLLFNDHQPMAMGDDKHYAAEWKVGGAIKAQRNLANGYRREGFEDGLPFFVRRYWPEGLRFEVYAMNAPAKRALEVVSGTGSVEPMEYHESHKVHFCAMDEAGWVRLEVWLRKLTAEQFAEGMESLKNSPLPEVPGEEPLEYHDLATDQRPAPGTHHYFASSMISAASKLIAEGTVTPGTDDDAQQ